MNVRARFPARPDDDACLQQTVTNTFRNFKETLNQLLHEPITSFAVLGPSLIPLIWPRSLRSVRLALGPLATVFSLFLGIRQYA